jgi:hypothetical protein
MGSEGGHPQSGSRRSARSVARTNGLEADEDGAMLISRKRPAACNPTWLNPVFTNAEHSDTGYGFGAGHPLDSPTLDTR